MAREQGFQITIKAWAKVDKTKPQTMISGAELAEGKSIEHNLSVLGLVDISVSSVYTSKAAPALPSPAVPENSSTIEVIGMAWPLQPDAPLLDPLDIPPELDRRQK